MNPKKSHWYYNLGLVLCDLGDHMEAQHNYKKAIDTNPQNDKAYFALATLQM